MKYSNHVAIGIDLQPTELHKLVDRRGSIDLDFLQFSIQQISFFSYNFIQ